MRAVFVAIMSSAVELQNWQTAIQLVTLNLENYYRQVSLQLYIPEYNVLRIYTSVNSVHQTFSFHTLSALSHYHTLTLHTLSLISLSHPHTAHSQPYITITPSHFTSLHVSHYHTLTLHIITFHTLTFHTLTHDMKKYFQQFVKYVRHFLIRTRTKFRWFASEFV